MVGLEGFKNTLLLTFFGVEKNPSETEVGSIKLI